MSRCPIKFFSVDNLSDNEWEMFHRVDTRVYQMSRHCPEDAHLWEKYMWTLLLVGVLEMSRHPINAIFEDIHKDYLITWGVYVSVSCSRTTSNATNSPTSWTSL